ncbi:uroplakin-2 [Eleutherodactylus coqui]|uniref:Uroplakin-2 n=1 Tax=Eleutherodactylus coqui TaxID=57060 RepID=A0A8J6JPV2_ELECQ|nr:hypothetical protein GDO78_014687 [Eleutherodactylus coqui]
MQPLTLTTLLLLIATTYGDNTTLSAGLVTNPYATSVILDVPPCKYSGKNATLHINGPNNETRLLAPFTVPQCRLKRDLIIVGNSQDGNVDTINVGYQVPGLSPSTKYTAWYEIDGTAFKSTQFTTETVSAAPPVTFRRSGGMVVITVLLAIAMVLLLVGLIVVLALGGRGAK